MHSGKFQCSYGANSSATTAGVGSSVKLRGWHLSEASEPETMNMDLRQRCDRRQKSDSILLNLPPKV